MAASTAWLLARPGVVMTRPSKLRTPAPRSDGHSVCGGSLEMRQPAQSVPMPVPDGLEAPWLPRVQASDREIGENPATGA